MIGVHGHLPKSLCQISCIASFNNIFDIFFINKVCKPFLDLLDCFLEVDLVVDDVREMNWDSDMKVVDICDLFCDWEENDLLYI